MQAIEDLKASLLMFDLSKYVLEETKQAHKVVLLIKKALLLKDAKTVPYSRRNFRNSSVPVYACNCLVERVT